MGVCGHWGCGESYSGVISTTITHAYYEAATSGRGSFATSSFVLSLHMAFGISMQ